MTTAEPPVLETNDLTVRFGGQVAVDGVSCAFHRGTLTAIVGPNGAGKTTYFNLISGQIRASAGEVRLRGERITRLAAPLCARRGLGRAFQLTNLFSNLSVPENVRLAVEAVHGNGLDMLRLAAGEATLIARAVGHLRRVQLDHRGNVPAAVLSHGDQRKLEIAILLALEPIVFMFDEPTAGMSVDEMPVILDLIETIRAEGDKTILLVEHKMDVVRRLADRVIVLHNGALVADGAPEAVDYMAEQALLTLSGVHTHIGSYHILHGVDLIVREGRLTMLLGRNGAGKTTTLRTIIGLWRASEGAILFDGAAITARPTADIARAGIAYVPETMGIFAGLSVQENLLLATGAKGFPRAGLARVIELFPELGRKWHDPAGTLSGGQKQMLAIGRAIIEQRRLLVVDEPTKGLAPAVIDRLIDAFARLKEERTSILLVEQNFAMARVLGDDVAVMDDGRIAHSGAMAALAADTALQTRLLGLSLASHQ